MSIARRQHSLLCTAVWHGNAAAVYHHHMKEWQKARMTPLNGYWPWPCLIAHRGAGTLAPENTLAAMRTGQAHGLRMMEYDVRLTRDGIPVLLHDDTLNRTSNGRGHLAEHSLDALLKLDFGAWHSAAYAGEPIPTLYSIAAYTLANGLHSNIEIKAACGTEAETGTIIARTARDLWRHGETLPLISSFSPAALMAAREAAPELPRALLLDDALPDDWQARVESLGCAGLNLNHHHIRPEHIERVRAAGYFVTAWTVNDPQRATQMLDWGCNAVITDRIDCIHPDMLHANRSPSCK